MKNKNKDLMCHVNPLLDRIHMKNQALFSSKDKSKKKKINCCLLQFCLVLSGLTTYYNYCQGRGGNNVFPPFLLREQLS